MLPVTRQLLGKGGGRGGMWKKKQKRKWYLFFISPENWRFFLLFLRSVNIDRLRESYTYALAHSLHLVNFTQRYDLVWLCFEILMKKTGTVFCFLCGLKDFMMTLKS